VSVPDLAFSHPRLVALYDALEGERSDLSLYAELVNRYAARSVLDIGCGTGAFACFLARRGIDVTGLDPAEASIAVARCKRDANKVRWILGDATRAPTCEADMATMTGNVAQVFLTDAEWLSVLGCIARSLRPEGILIFETRDPADEPWRRWNREQTYRQIEDAAFGRVTAWCDVTKVDGPLVDFRWTYQFEADGAVVVSNSTLRFRSRVEIERSLEVAGYSVAEVLDAPDRPGRELVFVARRTLRRDDD
jgi:SAM-dependent methyltransferase